MKLKSAALIYFSPTGSTKKILNAIAKGLDIDKVKVIDMTLPDVRNTVTNHIEEDMSAIDGVTLEIDDSQCLRCFCCVGRCSQKARKIVFKKKLLVSNLLYFKNKTRNEPRLYL